MAILDAIDYQKLQQMANMAVSVQDRDLQWKLHTTKFGSIFNLNMMSAITKDHKSGWQDDWQHASQPKIATKGPLHPNWKFRVSLH